MRKDSLRAYRFGTLSQWNSCLISQADQQALQQNARIRPFNPYDPASTAFPTKGAHSPAITRAGEIVWCDAAGHFYRLLPKDDIPAESLSPFALSRSTRIVAAQDLWTIGPGRRSLERYESDTLTRLLAVPLPQMVVQDIAAGGGNTILALVRVIRENRGELERVWKLIRVDPSGRIVEEIVLQNLWRPKKVGFLPISKRLVVLTNEAHPRLHWFDASSGKFLFSRMVGGIRPCFAADAIYCDSNDRIFLAGADGRDEGGSAFVLVLDADENLADSVPMNRRDLPITGVTANHDTLIVTGKRSLLQFGLAAAVPQSSGDLRCTLVTPMMFSPDRDGKKGWLRLEVSAALPQGTSLELCVAATDDADVRSQLSEILSNTSLSASRKIQQLQDVSGVWGPKIVFADGQTTGGDGAPFSAPLFGIGAHYLLASVSLVASPNSSMPEISELRVLYPDIGLMDDLPAIYRGPESSDFLRPLVGLLEATTQDLDNHIATMSIYLHSETAPDSWLNFIARWLGVPWDDALETSQKRQILLHAADLALNRGIRKGLETLLATLIPGTPQRYRVTDAGADFGFAIVGGASSQGSALPAMLGGPTRWDSSLDSRAILCYTRLPCPGQIEDGAWQLSGKIRVEVAATSLERQKWEPWFRTLVSQMLPVTARLQLLWVAPSALRSPNLDGTQELGSTPLAQLGIDAITGEARLPEGKNRLSLCGPDMNSLIG